MAFTPGDRQDAVNVKAGDPLYVYYRNIVAVFASARRWNPAATLFLATTAVPPNTIDEVLDALGVAVEIVPFTHNPPKAFSDRFAASLYFLDVLASDVASKGMLLIDPDCIVAGPLPPLPDDAVVAHVMDYPPQRSVNGMSAVQAEEQHRELLESQVLNPYRHIGGEAVWVPRDLVRPLSSVMQSAYDYALARFEQGRAPWFTTEEQLLTASAREMHFTEADFVRRIWTARRLRDTRSSDLDLALWHVPAEKERGILTLADAASDRQSWFWNDDPASWRARAAKILGITPTLRRRIEHAVVSRLKPAN